jgi:hypothetical protein
MGLFVCSFSRDSMSVVTNMIVFIIPFIIFSGYFKNEAGMDGYSTYRPSSTPSPLLRKLSPV